MAFPLTEWTQIARATLHGDADGREALENLCRRYWEPVRQFIMLRGRTPDEAADLTQSYFLYLLDHAVLKKADRQRGKFRSFLLRVLQRFLNDERKHSGAERRGGNTVTEELDDEFPGETPDDARFDRQWAIAVMDAAIERIARECESERGAEVFEVLKHFLSGGDDAPTCETAAAALGIPAGTFKSEVHRWRHRLRAAVRSEVAQTVSAPHEIDGEMEYLRQLLTT